MFGAKFINYGIRAEDREFLHMIQDLRATMKKLIIKEATSVSNQGNQKISIISMLSEKGEFDCNNEEHILGMVNDVMSFFLAGKETTANMTCMTLYYLQKHPKLLEEVVKEVDSVVQSTDQIGQAELKKLTFLDACIKETLRYFGPIFILLPREAAQDNMLDDIHVKKGTVVTAAIMANHYSPKYFENPEEYNPYRWISQGNKEQKEEPFA